MIAHDSSPLPLTLSMPSSHGGAPAHTRIAEAASYRCSAGHERGWKLGSRVGNPQLRLNWALPRLAKGLASGHRGNHPDISPANQTVDGFRGSSSVRFEFDE